MTTATTAPLLQGCPAAISFKVFASIFDPPGASSSSFWMKPSDINQRKPSQHPPLMMTGALQHRSSKSMTLWKTCTYELFGDKLYRTRENELLPSSFTCIENLRLEKLKSSEPTTTSTTTIDFSPSKYGFRLTTNQTFIELFCTSKDVMKTWYKCLKPHCVLTTFSVDYSILKLIGKGNFGRVYLARSKRSPQAEFAVKAFDKSKFASIDIDRPALVKEISILRRISHPQLTRMYEVYESDTHIFLVNELLKGGELFHLLKGRSKTLFTEPRVSSIIHKLLDALSYLASKNILHRDIKPENLILRESVSRDDTSSADTTLDVCLADFGLADFYDPKGQYMFTRCGTPGYVAPEVLADKPYDYKVDVFSVGVIMFILLTGVSPFKGKSYNEIVEKNYNCDIDYSTFNADQPHASVSLEAKDLLFKLLKKDPAERPTAENALQHAWITKTTPSVVVGNIQIRKLARRIQKVVDSPGSRKSDDSSDETKATTVTAATSTTTTTTATTPHQLSNPHQLSTFSRVVHAQMNSVKIKRTLNKSTSMVFPSSNIEPILSPNIKMRLPEIKSQVSEHEGVPLTPSTPAQQPTRAVTLHHNYNTISLVALRNLEGSSNTNNNKILSSQQAYFESPNSHYLKSSHPPAAAAVAALNNDSQFRSFAGKSSSSPLTQQFNTSMSHAATMLLKQTTQNASPLDDLYQTNIIKPVKGASTFSQLPDDTYNSPQSVKFPLINRSLQVSLSDLAEDSLSQLVNGQTTTTAAAARKNVLIRRKKQPFGDVPAAAANYNNHNNMPQFNYTKSIREKLISNLN